MTKISEHYYNNLTQDNFNDIFNLEWGLIVALNYAETNGSIIIEDSPDIENFSAIINLGNKLSKLKISNCNHFNKNSIIQILNHTNTKIEITDPESINLEDNQIKEFIQNKKLVIIPSTSISPTQYHSAQQGIGLEEIHLK